MRPRPSRDPRGKTLFYIEVVANGREVQRLPVIANIRVYADVLVSVRQLDKNTLCEEADFSLERREITLLRANPVFDYISLRDRRTARIIGKGTVLCEKDIERVPCVTKGEILSVILQTKNLRIDLRGRALADGWIGDKIWIRLLDGQQKYLATIHRSKVAKIQY